VKTVLKLHNVSQWKKGVLLSVSDVHWYVIIINLLDYIFSILQTFIHWWEIIYTEFFFCMVAYPGSQGRYLVSCNDICLENMLVMIKKC
jgi:hypothetical protein